MPQEAQEGAPGGPRRSAGGRLSIRHARPAFRPPKTSDVIFLFRDVRPRTSRPHPRDWFFARVFSPNSLLNGVLLW